MARIRWKNSSLLAVQVTLLLLTTLAAAKGEVEDDAATSSEAVTQPTFEDFFKSDEISDATISPDGEIIVYRQRNWLRAGNAQDGFKDLINIGNTPIIELDWSSADTLLLQYGNANNGGRGIAVRQIGNTENGLEVIRKADLTISGYIFDPLPGSPDHILFAEIREEEDLVAADLFRLNLYDKVYPQTKRKRRLNAGGNNLFFYLRNADGSLAYGVGFPGGAPEIWRKESARTKWSHVWTGPDEAIFEPVSLSPDSRTMWVLSNLTTDKVAAVAFDLETATIREVVFEHQRYDLNGILLSDDRTEPVGVTYLDSGLHRHHYFDAGDREFLENTLRKLPGEGGYIVDQSQDRTAQLIFTSSAGNPGSIHACNSSDEECVLIAKTRPWLDDVTLATTESMQVESTGGLLVDAFLTMPVAREDKIPLIALPHGGPIGVADDKYYSGDIQWLAHNGYAVIQVNYRGSSGYGKEFLDAGLKQRGRGIEDDIELSVQKALKENPVLDPDRVCIFGSSYGGYSALVSVIERPDTYRCGASFAAVTDLTLRFNRSGFRDDDETLEFLIESIGDPEKEMDTLVAYSPVYQYERINRPVFIAHGDNDSIVDVEHSWRLRKMMRLIGRDPEFHIFENVGHSFENVEQARALYDPLISFLDRHLKPSFDSD